MKKSTKKQLKEIVLNVLRIAATEILKIVVETGYPALYVFSLRYSRRRIDEDGESVMVFSK